MSKDVICTDCGEKKNNYKTRYFSTELGDLVNPGELICEECLDKRIDYKRKDTFKLVTAGG